MIKIDNCHIQKINYNNVVFLVDVGEQLNNRQYYWQLLSGDEKKRSHLYLNQFEAIRYIIARGILREIIALKKKIPHKDIYFFRDEYGKPSLTNHKDFFFNMSYSYQYISFFFSNKNHVGIDIELLTPEILAQFNLVNNKLVLTDYEFEYLEHHNTPVEEFYKIWCAKESISKAIGLGMYLDFRDIDILLSKGQIKYRDMQYYHGQYLVKDNLFFSYAVAKDSSPPIFFTLNKLCL